MTCGNMMEIIGLGFQVQILEIKKEIMDNKEYLLLSNIHGSRDSSVSWIDNNYHFWLFGGTGFDSTGNQGE